MKESRKIELLAPARDVVTGMEAIRHGADAVYIGASKFGARAAAANSTDDIHRLAQFAHIFGAKVYATLNTILYDSELAEAERLASELYDAEVDALIVQDTSFLSMSLPPMPLHASTQIDNRSPEKINRLAADGFDTVVLARELSLDEIRTIHTACSDVRLEAFVHGALCVSLSGRCYASQCCFGRSANRGECAQFCRLPFNLENDKGKTFVRHKHLLSLRDMNRSRYLEALMDAGICAFKIEGRLKDVSYVKNITAYYRKLIDEILARRDEYCRASFGAIRLTFEPVPAKSFNRGFTDYFTLGRSHDMVSVHTPKSIGECVGTIRDVFHDSFTVSGNTVFHNGDGLCFFDETGELCGFRVNRAEGNRLYPYSIPSGLKKHKQLLRNHDAAFERILSKPSAERRIGLDMTLSETCNGYSLLLQDELKRSTVYTFACTHETARTEQRENLRKQLSRLGNTPFYLRSLKFFLAGERFIPSSLIVAARREAVTQHTLAASAVVRGSAPVRRSVPLDMKKIDYIGNVSNSLARDFYRRCGVTSIEPAYELQPPHNAIIMTCRYCIRHAIGACLREKSARILSRSLFLRMGDGRRFRLSFDCNKCMMYVHASE